MPFEPRLLLGIGVVFKILIQLPRTQLEVRRSFFELTESLGKFGTCHTSGHDLLATMPPQLATHSPGV